MTHLFKAQELLNITTGVLHTKMDDIHAFFDKVIESGVFAHMLPKALNAIQPILQEKLSLPFSGFHPELENQLIAFEFSEIDIKRFWSNMS